MLQLRFAVAVALSAALAGCESADTKERPPAPAPANPQPPAPRPPAADPDEERAIGRYLTDLDSEKPNRIYAAAQNLLNLKQWKRTLGELRARLDGTRVAQQEQILQAIADLPETALGPIPREMVGELVPLVANFLGSPEATLRSASVMALVALDAAQPDDASGQDPAFKLVRGIIDQPKDQGATVAERISAVRVISRKSPLKAVEILKKTFAQAGIIPDVREAIREELKRITGESFRNAAQLEEWYRNNRDKPQDQWWVLRLQQVEREANSARDSARALWRRYMTEIAANAANPQRLASELKDSLATSEVPEIRMDAARELLKTTDPLAYDAVLSALKKDENIDVRASHLRALGEKPPQTADQRAAVVKQILDKVDADEKEIRLAAVNALGELRNDAAIPALLNRLQNPNRDADVARAVLAAIRKIGAKAEARVQVQGRWSTVGKELNDFLQIELERPSNSPQRDARLVEEAATTLGTLQFAPGAAETARAVNLLGKALEWNDPSDPRTTTVVRTNAIFSLGQLERAEALTSLAVTLDDKEETVAAEAARAMGRIAGGKTATDKDRAAALRRLVEVFDGTRNAVKDAAVDAIREILKDAPASFERYAEVTDRLNQTKDSPRIVRLLSGLPKSLPPDAPVPSRKALVELRRALAEAYEPSDPKAALEIWADLAKDDFARFGERYADALAASGNEKADEQYKLLIKALPGDAQRFWAKRLTLIEIVAKTNKRAARDLLDNLRTEPGRPPAMTSTLDTLEPRVGPANPTPPGGGTGGTVPSSVPKGGQGGGR
jgi:HEAT repeat protein